MRCPPLPRRRRRAGAAALLLAVVVLVGACGSDPSEGAGEADTSTTSLGSSTTSSTTTTGAPAAHGASCSSPGGDLAGFAATTVAVVGEDGARTERCVAVADTAVLRAQGLMGVTELVGVDGMVFAYRGVSSGGYWMRDTPMPLSIAWIGLDGEVVATADMEPCLDGGSQCPSYEPGAPYRWAVEVPQGGLERFGLVDGARMDVSSLPPGRD